MLKLVAADFLSARTKSTYKHGILIFRCFCFQLKSIQPDRVPSPSPAAVSTEPPSNVMPSRLSGGGGGGFPIFIPAHKTLPWFPCEGKRIGQEVPKKPWHPAVGEDCASTVSTLLGTCWGRSKRSGCRDGGEDHRDLANPQRLGRIGIIRRKAVWKECFQLKEKNRPKNVWKNGEVQLQWTSK